MINKPAIGLGLIGFLREEKDTAKCLQLLSAIMMCLPRERMYELIDILEKWLFESERETNDRSK